MALCFTVLILASTNISTTIGDGTACEIYITIIMFVFVAAATVRTAICIIDVIVMLHCFIHARRAMTVLMSAEMKITTSYAVARARLNVDCIMQRPIDARACI